MSSQRRTCRFEQLAPVLGNGNISRHFILPLANMMGRDNHVMAPHVAVAIWDTVYARNARVFHAVTGTASGRRKIHTPSRQIAWRSVLSTPSRFAIASVRVSRPRTTSWIVPAVSRASTGGGERECATTRVRHLLSFFARASRDVLRASYQSVRDTCEDEFRYAGSTARAGESRRFGFSYCRWKDAPGSAQAALEEVGQPYGGQHHHNQCARAVLEGLYALLVCTYSYVGTHA